MGKKDFCLSFLNMYMRITLYLYIFLLIGQHVFAQVTIGFQSGFNFTKDSGGALCDSIRVINQPGSGGTIYVGIITSYSLTKSLMFQAELNTFRNHISPNIYNHTFSCAFCPVIKGTVVGYRTFEFPVSVILSLPVRKEFYMNVAASVIPEINLRQRPESVSFGGQHTGVADVINAIQRQSTKDVVLNYSTGFQIKVQRLLISARMVRNLSKSVTKDIVVWGQQFPYRTNQTSFRIGIAYVLKK